MPTYNASQRSSIAQFVSFTSTKESIAGRVRCLPRLLHAASRDSESKMLTVS